MSKDQTQNEDKMSGDLADIEWALTVEVLSVAFERRTSQEERDAVQGYKAVELAALKLLEATDHSDIAEDVMGRLKRRRDKLTHAVSAEQAIRCVIEKLRQEAGFLRRKRSKRTLMEAVYERIGRSFSEVRSESGSALQKVKETQDQTARALQSHAAALENLQRKVAGLDNVDGQLVEIRCCIQKLEENQSKMMQTFTQTIATLCDEIKSLKKVSHQSMSAYDSCSGASCYDSSNEEILDIDIEPILPQSGSASYPTQSSDWDEWSQRQYAMDYRMHDVDYSLPEETVFRGVPSQFKKKTVSIKKESGSVRKVSLREHCRPEQMKDVKVKKEVDVEMQTSKTSRSSPVQID